MAVAQLLSNRFVVALVVPLLLFLAGGFGKKLVRSEKNWHRKDWYLGVDAALAAFSAALIYLFDVAGWFALTPSFDPRLQVYTRQLAATGVFLALAFFCSYSCSACIKIGKQAIITPVHNGFG